MSSVTDIWLFVQTSGADSSYGTKASLKLIVQGPVGVYPDGDPGIILATSSQQTSTNGITTPGTSAQFHWQEGPDWPPGTMTTDNIKAFALSIVGPNSGDAWLPSSIWVTYLSDEGMYALGPQNPTWPSTDGFSTEPSDFDGTAKGSWVLPWDKH